MANVSKHTFVSAKADGSDSTRVRPSNWNAEHTFAGGSDGQAVVRDSGQSDGANWAWRGRVLSINTTAADNGTTVETDLMSYTLPAATLAADGAALRVTVWGTTAANANTKTLKFKFGATSVTFNPVTTAPNNLVWIASFIIVRTGAATQEMICVESRVGAVNELGSRTTPAETLSSSVVIKVTGQSGTASNDISQKGMLVEALNT
jgi:hypothetical protein